MPSSLTPAIPAVMPRAHTCTERLSDRLPDSHEHQSLAGCQDSEAGDALPGSKPYLSANVKYPRLPC